MWSPVCGLRDANTRSGAPGRSSKEGCIGTGSAWGSRPSAWARTCLVVGDRGHPGVLEEALRVPAVARLAQRSGHEGDRPPGRFQRRNQVSNHLRRSAPGIEQEAHPDEGKAVLFRGFPTDR